jgi:hypothetical protein
MYYSKYYSIVSDAYFYPLVGQITGRLGEPYQSNLVIYVCELSCIDGDVARCERAKVGEVWRRGKSNRRRTARRELVIFLEHPLRLYVRAMCSRSKR